METSPALIYDIVAVRMCGIYPRDQMRQDGYFYRTFSQLDARKPLVQELGGSSRHFYVSVCSRLETID